MNENMDKNRLVNGEIISETLLASFKVEKGDAFFLQNESYLERFVVQDFEKDAGTVFVRCSGHSSGEVIFEMSYLRKQYARQCLKLYDNEGNMIGTLN